MSERAREPDLPTPRPRAPRLPWRENPVRTALGVLMVVAGALITLTLAWIVITGLVARSKLDAARSDLHAVQKDIVTGDFVGAQGELQSMAGDARTAHTLTSGPVWAFVARLPGGEPLRTTRAIADQVDSLGSVALKQIVDAGAGLDPDSLRTPDGRIDLDRVSSLKPVLDNASTSLRTSIAALEQQPARTWLGSVDSARADLLEQFQSLQKTVGDADLAVGLLPRMLGSERPQRYFVAFENDAEARGTGGIPGAFGILVALDGRLSFERFEPDSTLKDVRVGAHYGPGYDQLFSGAGTTSLYVNTNLSPHFPYAARTWIAMWHKYSGEQLDGAIALDPQGLAYLLKVTGPAHLPTGGAITANNVVARTENDVYAKFPAPGENKARKRYLLQIARAVSNQLLDLSSSPVRLLTALGQASGERRLLLYSADPSIEASIARFSLGGTIPQTRDPYVGLSIVNDGGNKLDYYLDRSLTWRANGCAVSRTVSVTIALHNGAPAGLSPYVTARSDRHAYAVRPGDNRLEVSYYATAGAQLTSVLLDGRPATASVATDLGHPVYTVDVELPRASTRTMTLLLREPNNGAAPIVLRQPLVRPLDVTVDAGDCR